MPKKTLKDWDDIKIEMQAIVKNPSLTKTERDLIDVIISLGLKLTDVENQVTELKEEVGNIPIYRSGGLM